jgi:hypothetical protein
MLNDIESEPFNDFESVAEIIGFVHRKHGVAAVQELLALMSEPAAKPWLLTQEERVVTTRENLEGAADGLESAGLRKLAKLVREHAMGRPSELDLSPYEPGSINHAAWLAGMKRRRKK